MSPLSSLVLGLGLFFLGLQLVGQNLRQLSGGGFRNLVKSATHTPLLAAVLGLVAGALMQSATAVTFILVSMVGSGLIQTAPARIVVIWCNVGLTALAFLAAFNIHPLVAWLVGGAGILVGSVRVKPWNTIAGALLGVGIILFALGEMGAGAEPLKNEAWFRSAMDAALSSPIPAFLSGIAAAALLQSNTGAAMLVITLSAAGAIPLSHAMPVIYGTNLGAIVLRFFLSVGMKGSAMRLVRMEDLFCLISGVIMMVLYFLEMAGVPLVGALLRASGTTPAIQLAIVFLLSNLVPALLMMPLLGPCAALLKRAWPDDRSAAADAPEFLTSQALEDPATALDLIPRELSRLLSLLEVAPAPPHPEDPENHTPPAFARLGTSIEDFCARLASRNPLSHRQALRLQTFRAWLHTIRHIAEAVGEFADAQAALSPAALAATGPLHQWLQNNIALAAAATHSLAPADIEKFHESSKPHSDSAHNLREELAASMEKFPAPDKLALSALADDFDIAAWLIHRISKLELRLAPQSGVSRRNPS